MTSSSSPRRLSDHVSVRALLAGLVLFGLFCWFFDFLTDQRGFKNWLFVQLSLIWSYEILLTAACASFGLSFVERLCGMRALPFVEKLAYALPVGLIAFVAGMYLGGFLGWYGPTFALALPLLLLLIGLPGLGARLALNLRGWSLRRAPSVASLAATSFGTLGIALVYLGLLTPDAVNYDASWNHLVIAQDYARAGRITPLIGDWVKNVPHLGSIVNTWAFLVPGHDEAPLRWMQALHNEFTTFLWSLVAIAAAVRVLSERYDSRAGWAAIFLFPSILVYDGNMGAAADHYLAVFSVPVLLAGLRLLEMITWRRAVLLGWLAGGALLTKLHAVYLLIPLSMLIGARVVWIATHRAEQTDEERLGRVLSALALGGVVAVALLALHFGKNALFYRNPFYPMAQGSFPSEPTLPDAQVQMDYLFGDWHWHPPKKLGDRLEAAAKMMFTFSFKPHYTFIGDVPTFGSLFTLLTPLIFFLKRARRLVLAVVITTLAVFTWANTFWVDRSLQTFMPAMAAVTGALIVRGWELGVLVRVPLAALIGLQIVWGGDYYCSGSDRIESSIALIKSGMDGTVHDRFDSYRRDYRALGRSLPDNALVMLHNNHVMLGIDRPVLLDWAGYQAVIDYRQYKSPRDLHERLQKLGVTHVVYLPGARSAPTKQEEIIFAAYANLNAHGTENFGGLRVFPVAKKPPRLARPLQVLAWNLANYAPGLYPIEALSSLEEMPPELQLHPWPPQPLGPGVDPLKLLEEADALIARSGTSLPGNVRDALNAQFINVRSHANYAVWVRKTPGLGTLK
jgi:hypothetical protein